MTSNAARSTADDDASTADNDAVAAADVKNPAALLKRNGELIAELKAARAALTAAETARDTAQADGKQWRERWHTVAVMEPFEAELRALATVPTRYLRELVTEHGLLKFEPDGDGVDRPRWYGADGKPADAPDGGAAGHLSRTVHDLRGPGATWKADWAAELERCIPRAQGSGALGNSGGNYRPAPKTEAPPAVTAAPVPALGLR